MPAVSRSLLRQSAQFTLLHAVVVLWWRLVAGPVDVGSWLMTSLLGGVLSAILGGLWLGARGGEAMRAWLPARPGMPTEPWSAFAGDVCGAAIPVGVAGGLGCVATLVWSGWTDTTLAQVIAAHGVFLATVVAAAGVGVWLESLLRARRLTLVYGAALWAAPLSAFALISSTTCAGSLTNTLVTIASVLFAMFCAPSW